MKERSFCSRGRGHKKNWAEGEKEGGGGALHYFRKAYESGKKEPGMEGLGGTIEQTRGVGNVYGQSEALPARKREGSGHDPGSRGKEKTDNRDSKRQKVNAPICRSGPVSRRNFRTKSPIRKTKRAGDGTTLKLWFGKPRQSEQGGGER